MMLKKMLLVLMSVMVISTLTAFDDKREGLLYGIGMGYCQAFYKNKIEDECGVIKTVAGPSSGVATEVKLGYGISNKAEIYLSNQVAWYSRRTFEGETSQAVTINSMTSLGVSYFFSEQLDYYEWHSSPFVSGGLGRFYMYDFLYDDGYSSGGIGFYVGLGYEFAKHVRLSLNYYVNNQSYKEDGNNYTKNSNVMLLTLSALAF